MRPLRPLAAAALLAAALAVPAAAGAAPLELTSDTVVSAARSGFTDVVLPADARLSARAERNPDVQVSGAGRFVGVWLERLGDDSPNEGLSSVRLPGFLGSRQLTAGSYAPGPDCTGTPEVMPLHYDCSGSRPPQAILLHAGRYRLTVLTDGHPLTFRLLLHGLEDAATTLSPTRALTSVQRPLPAREAVGDRLVTFGATAPVPGPVSSWVLATATGTEGAPASGRSICVRQDAAAAPPLGYGPPCPGGQGGAYAYQVGGTYGMVGGFTVSSDADGDVGLGGSFGSSDGVRLGSTLGVWLQRPS